MANLNRIKKLKKIRIHHEGTSDFQSIRLIRSYQFHLSSSSPLTSVPECSTTVAVHVEFRRGEYQVFFYSEDSLVHSLCTLAISACIP